MLAKCGCRQWEDDAVVLVVSPLLAVKKKVFLILIEEVIQAAHVKETVRSLMGTLSLFGSSETFVSNSTFNFLS